MKVQVLELDKPNKNGRVYPKSVVERSLVEFNIEHKVNYLPLYKNYSTTPTVQDVVGYVDNFGIEEGFLVANVNVMETQFGMLEGKKFCFRPIGSAVITEDGVVTNYRILGFTIVYEKE